MATRTFRLETHSQRIFKVPEERLPIAIDFSNYGEIEPKGVHVEIEDNAGNPAGLVGASLVSVEKKTRVLFTLEGGLINLSPYSVTVTAKVTDTEEVIYRFLVVVRTTTSIWPTQALAKEKETESVRVPMSPKQKVRLIRFKNARR